MASEPGGCLPTGGNQATRKPNRTRKASSQRGHCAASVDSADAVERHVAIAQAAVARQATDRFPARRPRRLPHFPPEHCMTFDLIKAIVLGMVEGLTEFMPVSSTGHLLLVQRFFGFADEDFGKTFAVLIQFGAILALLSIYFVRLWQARDRLLHRSGGAPLRDRRADRVPAGGGGRRAGARLHQDACCSTMAGLLHADRRRRGAAVGRHARPQAALPRRHEVHAADVFHHRPRAVPRR